MLSESWDLQLNVTFLVDTTHQNKTKQVFVGPILAFPYLTLYIEDFTRQIFGAKQLFRRYSLLFRRQIRFI